MKRTIVSILCALCMTGSAFAQNNAETVYLHNGSVIKGQIIEEVPNQSIKVRTKDGNIFVYKMSDVSRITREDADKSSFLKRKGVEFKAGVGYNIATKGGGGSFMMELGMGKRFTPNIYWTFLSTGIGIPTGDYGDVGIPLMTRLGILFPLRDTKIMPTITFGTGGYFTPNADYNNACAMIEAIPGIQIPLSKRVDLNTGVGYSHSFYSGGGGGAVAIKVGFDFHRAGNRPNIPTRDHGLQLSVEGHMMNPWNYFAEKGSGHASLDIVPTYKLNSHLSLGIGYGIGMADLEYYNDSYGYGTQADAGTYHKFFLRGQFRLNDKKISPMAAVDLGIKKYVESGYTWEGFDDYLLKVKKSTLFIDPSVGVSIRTTNNSYLDMKLGYHITGKYLKAEGKPGNDEKPYDIGTSSGILISIGWTHTFKWGSNWFKGEARNWGNSWVK